MFKIGEKVIVTDKKQIIRGYKNMAELMELTNWQEELNIKKNIIYKIIAKSYRDTDDAIVYGVEDNTGKQYIMHFAGLDKLKEPIIKPIPKSKIQRNRFTKALGD